MSYIFIFVSCLFSLGMGNWTDGRAFLTTGETAVLFHAFRKFRNNVDLMTTRVAASYLNLAFGHVLGRVEQLRENNPTDAGLLPLHRMTSEWIERLVEHYR